MKIMVSACLLGENCKYNGGNNYSQKVNDYCKGHEIIKVCPEVMGGLTIPRHPCEIVDGSVINCSGVNVNEEFVSGANKAFCIAKDENVDLVILQSRSPSCGINKIYDGSFSGKLIEGHGIFAKLLIKNGFNVIDVENI